MQYPLQVALLQAELKNTYDELLKKLSAEKDPILNAFPEFVIAGTIGDYLKGDTYTTFQIWGTAMPQPMTERTLRSLGFRRERSNLIEGSL
jgi:hypothetical protein